MKKKAIEKIAPYRLSKAQRGKYKNKGDVAAARVIDGVLIIDLINLDRKEHHLRICLTKTEFANWYPMNDMWDGKRIKNIYNHEIHNITSKRVIGNDKIISFFKLKYPSSMWDNNIDCAESDISYSKIRRKEQKLANACKRRNERVPELTDEMIKWLTELNDERHFIYYKRKGKKCNIVTSCCNTHKEMITRTETYEDSLKPYMPAPAHNERTICPFCGEKAIYKAIGRTKGIYAKRTPAYILQKCDEDIVVRYFEVENCIVLASEDDASENTIIHEVTRNFYMTSGNVQRDFHKYDYYDLRSFWDYKNLSGLGNITQRDGKVYLHNVDQVIKSTRFEYANIASVGSRIVDITEYMNAFNKYPSLELFEKLGMKDIVKYIMRRYQWATKLNPQGTTGAEVLLIDKQRFKDIVKYKGNMDRLDIYQYEYKNNVRFSEKDETLIIKLGWKAEDYSIIRAYAKPEKLYNYLTKAAGVDKKAVEDKCSRAIDQLRQYATTYKDYVKLCIRNERVLDNSHLIYPVDLHAYHQRELIYGNEHEFELTMKEKCKENPNIKKDAPRYNREFKYQNEKYIIRAPKDAGEIYLEGATLNHCVGRMGYIESMNRHETTILFLRKKKEKDYPFYTLEVKDGKVKQAYGLNDSQPDWDNVKLFLNDFKKAKLSTKDNMLTISA